MVETVKVLIVDDNVQYKNALSEALSEIPQVEVVGAASSGREALAKLESLKPDIMTLNFEMADEGGLETLRKLKDIGAKISVVMVSSHSREGAKVALKALDLGAFAFLAKPERMGPLESKKSLLTQLKPIISAFSVQKLLATRRGFSGQELSTPQKVTVVSSPRIQDQLSGAKTPRPPVGLVQIVGIGISTGGPKALTQVIPLLPENIRVPVVIVQHMPPVFTGALAESLNSKSRIRVVEGADDMPLASGTVYIAPGGKQMKIVRKGNMMCMKITDDPPENHCKPSADYLFRSIAELYGNKALGVIMTGMGSDGTLGLEKMKEKGACVIAQSEESCVVFGMPLEAISAGVVDVVCPLSDIAAEIVKRVN